MKRILFINFPAPLKEDALSIQKEINTCLASNSDTDTHTIAVPKEISINEFLIRSRAEMLEELEVVGRGSEEDYADSVNGGYLYKTFN